MERLKEYLKLCSARCSEYFFSYPMNDIKPEELKLGATEYFNRGGKRLRPAFISLCAGATGGKSAEYAVIPAMVSAELFHTFTLVHDDIIDNDATRRGGKSVHILIRDMFSRYEKCESYGRDVAILAGDTLHALSVKMLLECDFVKPETLIAILKMLEGECINGLLEGETNDTRLGLIKGEAFDTGNFKETFEVMRLKTGALFSYCAKAGAMLGLDTPNENDEHVKALGEFAMLCGIAFQLKDDILGITSNVKTFGKPICSDIREGKKTLILQKAYENASVLEKDLISKTVGNADATDSEIDEVKNIFITRGGVAYAECLAAEYIAKAQARLAKLEKSEYTELLMLVSEYMSARKL